MEHWISGRQIKAARALLGWKRRDLASHCGISADTVRVVEADEANMAVLAPTRAEMRHALEAAGISFSADSTLGVRLSPPVVSLMAAELNASNDD